LDRLKNNSRQLKSLIIKEYSLSLPTPEPRLMMIRREWSKFYPIKTLTGF
jgi:hypothetical protein